jgi:hypothetical protein
MLLLIYCMLSPLQASRNDGLYLPSLPTDKILCIHGLKFPDRAGIIVLSFSGLFKPVSGFVRVVLQIVKASSEYS